MLLVKTIGKQLGIVTISWVFNRQCPPRRRSIENIFWLKKVDSWYMLVNPTRPDF